jgi:hypothetical protein
MYRLLHMWIHCHHLRIQLRVIPHQHLRIPSTSHKDGVNATAERCSEHMAYLQSDKEGESKHNGCVCAVFVVRRVCEDEVAVGHEGASVGDEGRTDCEDRPYEAFVDESVDAAVFDHAAKYR